MFSWGKTPNLQYQRDILDHKHLPSVTIDGAEGVRKLLRVSKYQGKFGPSINQSCHLVFISGQPAQYEDFIASHDRHLEVILTFILNLGQRRTHQRTDCIPEASAGEHGATGMTGVERAGLNYCSGLNVFHMLPTQHCCLPVFKVGVWAAMRSNHICFWVTFTKPFTAFLFSCNFLIFLELTVFPYF